MNDATECPYCGGSINVGATRCRHCREDLRATLRPGQVIAEGSTLGDYVLGPLLGRGAMGLVFRAKKARLPREFAIKVLAPHLAADPDLVARFEEEARVQASLRHPHIVDVVDSIAAGGAFAFVMELIEGSTLEQLLAERRGPLPLPRILAIMDAALDAVGFAHEQDIVHRDLKPGNILLARVAGREVVKVADFGLARVLGNQRRTATGAALGTYLYMAPEQCRGDLDVDHRADLYSLGATLFELVTGLTPFTGKTDYEIVGGHLQRPPPRPSELVPTLPRELDDVILRALEKSPAARFPSAAAFRAALADVPHALRPAPPPANPLRATGTLPASVKEGAILGRYRLDAKLGEGAMGAVFRATDLELPRAVAVKVLSQEVVAMPGIVERLAREARLQAAVPHPHIVAVHDFVQRGGFRRSRWSWSTAGRWRSCSSRSRRCPRRAASRSSGPCSRPSPTSTRKASSTATSSRATSCWPVVAARP
jgi:serine/threonine protein kinase